MKKTKQVAVGCVIKKIIYEVVVINCDCSYIYNIIVLELVVKSV